MDITTFAPAYEANQTIKQSMLQSAISADNAEQNQSALKMTLWETRKLNEHHQSLMKEQIWQTKNLETQMYRQEKKSFLDQANVEKIQMQEQVKNEVAK